MKEYINRLSLGKFRYDIPDIIKPDDVVRADVLCGTYSEEQLHIQASDVIKGVVYSSDSRVVIKNGAFIGRECNITYIADARELQDKESIEGRFTIVSDAGEKDIAYIITGYSMKAKTSLGMGDDLFHFTNIVQKSREEAAVLYRSENFKSIFLKNDENLINLYESLYDSENVYESMEEFLIAIKKKSPLTFKMDTQTRTYSLSQEGEKDSLIIEKSGWGYIELEVECDADYIKMKRGTLNSDDFVGDIYELEYLIDYSRLHNGNNYTSICVRSYGHEEQIDLIIYKENKETDIDKKNDGFDIRMEQRSARIALTQAYMAFRMKRIDREQWISDTGKMLTRVRGLKESDIVFDVFQAGLDFIAGNVFDGKQILENIKDKILTDVSSHVELYCLYLYVSTLERKDALYTSDVSQIVSRYYDNGYDTWVLLWILFYIDGQIEHNKSIKLIRIKDSFNNGCTSPVMYIEALNIYNEQPDLLRVMNRFEIQVISEGIKYGVISERLARQAAEVIGNEKTAGMSDIELLKRLYESYEEDNILEALIVHMIRTGIADEESFTYYEKAVLRGIRITRLYEFYMASIKKDIKLRLPKIVLMYFTYDSGVNYSWKSYLYANIVYNKELYKELYDSYKHIIELYVYEQLKQENIDSNLVYLYKKFIKPQLVKNDTAAFLAKLKFMYHITCFDEDVKAVMVKYSQIQEPVIYELTGKDTYIPLYTKECSLVFICNDGRKRKKTVDYEIEKIFEEPGDMSEYDQYDIDDKYITIYKVEYYRKKHIYKMYTLELYKLALGVEGISEQYRKKLNSWMIEFYLEYYNAESFTDEYKQLDTYNLSVRDSACLVKILIDYGMYYEARQLIDKYGYADVDATKLFMFMVHELEASVNEEEYKNKISEYVFKKHLYNESLLTYMVEHYNSTNTDMYVLWKTSKEFGVNVDSLSERIISQMMFTNVYSNRLAEVFADYYNNVAGYSIVKAYAAYNSYNYVIKNKKADPVIFKVIERAYKDKIGLPLLCYIAWLKEKSLELSLLNESDIKKIAQSILDELCEKELIYNFYKKFNGILSIPYNAYGLTVIEYFGIPDRKVELHYRINDDKEYKTAVMKSDICGIFTYKLLMFYDDKITYYFTTSDGEKTKEYNMVCDDVPAQDAGKRLDAINECLASEELHDMVTLKKLMNSYVTKAYVSEEIFKKID